MWQLLTCCRTFQLFNYIGLKPGKGGLIPYYIGDEDNVCPTYFNDVSSVGNVWTAEADDPFKINEGLPDKAKIPVQYAYFLHPRQVTNNNIAYSR